MSENLETGQLLVKAEASKRWPNEILVYGLDTAGDWAIALLNEAIAASFAEASEDASLGPKLTRVDWDQTAIFDAPVDVDKACVILVPSNDPPAYVDFSSIEAFTKALQLEGHRLIFAIEIRRRYPQTVVIPFPPEDLSSAARSLLGLLPETLAVSRLVAGPPMPAAADTPASPALEGADMGASSATEVSAELLQRMHFVRENYSARLKEWLLSGVQSQIVWPGEVFYNAGQVGLSPVIELYGNIRHILYGPYLPLPTGRWTMTACLGFGGPIADLLFMLEIGADKIMAKGYFSVPSSGIYQVSLPVTLEFPTQPIEVRFANQEIMIEGTIALLEVQFAPGEQD